MKTTQHATTLQNPTSKDQARTTVCCVFFVVLLFAAQGQAGWKDAEFGLLPDFSGGASMVVNVPFGKGEAKQVQRADPVGGDVKTGVWEGVKTHVSDNSVIYSLLGLVGTYALSAYNNHFWPFNKSDKDSGGSTATASSSGTTASGTSVVIININGDGNQTSVGGSATRSSSETSSPSTTDNHSTATTTSTSTSTSTEVAKP
jgi:hypothetical protein